MAELTPQQVNRRIAEARGVNPDPVTVTTLRDRGYDEQEVLPPDHCGCWADAGPLLEDLIDAGFVVLQQAGGYRVAHASGDNPVSQSESPAEAIARAWLVVFGGEP